MLVMVNRMAWVAWPVTIMVTSNTAISLGGIMVKREIDPPRHNPSRINTATAMMTTRGQSRRLHAGPPACAMAFRDSWRNVFHNRAVMSAISVFSTTRLSRSRGQPVSTISRETARPRRHDADAVGKHGGLVEGRG